MLGISKNYSSYLIQPSVRPDRAAQWNGFRTQFFEIKRANPHVVRNTLVILIVWCVCIGIVQSSSKPNTAAGVGLLPSSLPQAGSQLGSIVQTPAPVAQAPGRPTALPGGPSGQLMPPGTMEPFATYKNSYAWGQCTWYVAGRRQIPANWGNAVSWYYHAVNTGWQVGTTPAVAAVAWTPAGSYGHVALVEQVSSDGRQVYVSEMNYHGLDVKSYRWAAASSFKYIY